MAGLRPRQNQFNLSPSDIPIPTSRPPIPNSGPTVRRAKTLIRPERGVAPVPLINPPDPSHGSTNSANVDGSDAWRITSRVLTFWAPDVLLTSVGGMRDPNTRQAWREKIVLCLIIAVACAGVAFVTVGFQRVLCTNSQSLSSEFVRVGSRPGTLTVQGLVYNITAAKNPTNVSFTAISSKFPGQDVTQFFTRAASDFRKCKGLTARAAVDDPCTSTTPCQMPNASLVSTFTNLGFVSTGFTAGYDWAQVGNMSNYIVLNGAVLNMTTYLLNHPNPIPSDNVDKAIRTVLSASNSASGKDGTRLFSSRADLQPSIACLHQRYYAGNIDKITPGCFITNLVLYLGLGVILSLVLIRFFMAIVFRWYLSGRLAGNPDSKTLNRSAISPAVMPEGANLSVDNKNGTAPWANGSKKLAKGVKPSPLGPLSARTPTNPTSAPVMSLAQIGAELFAVCLVTCYSEGEESIRTTLDSISKTNYSDARKLLFIVADGMITGAGEKRSTPDICVGLLDADPRFGEPIPMSYGSVGSGAKAQNRAMVYAGHYTVAGRRTPTVIIVKCGTEEEARTDKKPGNRGKRDGQLILMNFFSRVTYNDRMTPLDFDLFRKIHVLMGVTPDFFEVCLMVDADTMIFPESLRHLVNCMHHDQMIMGVCGETRIANKRTSWVTAIQVFEYFISHHLAKAFESVFGGVSCLPGCFSMFRLKARKSTGDDWVPLIIKPEIVKEYSQSEVTTLHQKNLLLLGEDRFLTTILIRTFPNRKMMFLPQARCRTVVPDTFSVLLSQRRRWINSTIHNLMELVLVRNLCGTFCFSMQFVVFMDLLGTIVLPIAISLTYILIVTAALNPPKSFDEAIPIILLVAVLGLPAILIVITTGKVVYVFWMMIYLVALPVWNFLLPVYAFWHFDDFSWGETRKVEGEGKDKGHVSSGGVAGEVPMRRWEDWERSRLRKLRREERRRRDFDRAYPSGYFAEGDMLSVNDSRSQFDGSDSYSVHSSDDDHWGLQIGGYNEHNAQYPPPPTTLLIPHDQTLQSAETLDSKELEAMLEMGFDDAPPNSLPISRYQLQDASTSSLQLGNGNIRGNGYAPLTAGQAPLPTAVFSPTTPNAPTGPGRPRQQTYGPLGPLDPAI
ncbi:Glycosyltransferase family 2 protein [Mycena indigotica]|uniref:chitin synthase n=1 Tax=Mycena indigotica TaxID=2126181 RepID=A0A8H6WE36_9AGAR|nr:Glycosyltransferase family 2 protein [Mycena indigotica]KAF7315314.1 Glycosyltransferase family 2 protein [Mycena indigotica]